MTLEAKLLSLKIEGFYLEESVLSPTQAAEAYISTKATLKEGSGRIFGSTFLNHNQCLARYLAAPRIMEGVVAMRGSSARTISTSGILREPTALAQPYPPGGLPVDWPGGHSAGRLVDGALTPC